MEDVYRDLAVHLDSLPGGYPATNSGVELRILKRLFTRKEAKIAQRLTLIPETSADIAKRFEMDESELSNRLKLMSKKGLIFRITKESGNMYMAAQFVIGIWEYHVNDLSTDLIDDFNEYVPYLMKSMCHTHKTKQLRVIPISGSISTETKIMPYNKAEKIISEQTKITVSPCICRKERRKKGYRCKNPLETCLIFGVAASYYEENGLGRKIDVNQALEILKNGMSAGLVLQPSNSQKPVNICMCCSCCCHVLGNLSIIEKPAFEINAIWYAKIEESDCVSCGTCEKRCHMKAIFIRDFAVVDLDRCIGCGVCVVGCESYAINLIKRDEKEYSKIPKTIFETYLKIAKERNISL